jgi:dTDP-4-amino-4,6-dideoxygalactose transaminase
MEPLQELARTHGLRLIEDAAQAHGARDRGRRCGGLGDAASFSFYVTKNLGAVGEGGFVTTDDPAIAERVRLLRHHGHVSKQEHALVGFNWRMDELQAAVLRAKLPGLDAANARRREIARRYRARLAGSAVRLLVERPEAEAVNHVFAVRVADRDGLRAHLARHGIETGIHYAVPAHRQPALRERPHRRGPMAVTEAACRELLSLPMYPELTDEQLEWVVEHVLGFLDGGARRTA